MVMLLQTLSAPTFVNEFLITGLNFFQMQLEVLFCKYVVAEFDSPSK
jgi:hypothetical protein